MEPYKPPAPVKETAEATIVKAPALAEQEDLTMGTLPVLPTTTATPANVPTAKSLTTTWNNLAKSVRLSNRHEHHYVEVAGRNVSNGRTILYRGCDSCSATQAFEMLDREEARKLYLRIKGRKA